MLSGLLTVCTPRCLASTTSRSPRRISTRSAHCTRPSVSRALHGTTLVYSFIGFGTQEIAVGGQTTINVTMKASSQSLEEVVVVGYGTQKKSVVTGSISQVKAEALEGQPVTRIEQSLQGRTSGVFVSANAGQPGTAATVRIRGITTLNNNDPLYVVDGIIVDAGAVQLINQFDIESIEVLKDASAAVYGTQAAAGAILITTKKGKAGKLVVSYNGFGGLSNESRRVRVLNGQEYATLMNERFVNDGGAPDSVPYADPASYGAGTNWQDVIFQNAYRQSHDLSLSGGSETSKFYTSFSLIDQEGIVLPEVSRYTRKTFRLNSDHKIGKYLKVGQTATYSNEKSLGVGNTNSEFGGPLSSALNLDPLTPVVITDPAVANAYPYGGPTAQNGIFRDANGNPYGISDLVTNEMSNPLAYQEARRGQFGYAHNLAGNAYAEIEPIKGLKYRSVVAGKWSQYGSEGFTPEYYFNNSGPGNNDVNRITRDQRHNFYWSIENTLSYDRIFGDHHITALIGQAAYVWEGEQGQITTYSNLPVDTWDQASFGFQVPDAQRTTSAWTSPDAKIASLFARVTYDYKERYLLNAFIRRDGSTKFG
ncbi:MAG: SusC/RagA family TonB-linked outer membrane protein, partial [Sphingobacteriales bacterium]